MKNLFTHHPNSVGQGYFAHLFFALKYAMSCFKAGICAIIHALFPFLMESSASEIVCELKERAEKARVPVKK